MTSLMEIATVFMQGLLSFFSPCVIPLVPLYVGYLAGTSGTVNAAAQSASAARRRLLVRTLLFMAGIATAFFLLGFGFTAVGAVLSEHRVALERVAGVVIALFGAVQLVGSMRSDGGALSTEWRLPLRLDRLGNGPVFAYLLGFVFSFAWTPCVGPTLASVLLMASTAQTSVLAAVLIAVYTAGFAIPFMVVGLFGQRVLDAVHSKPKVLVWTVRAGALIMIAIGALMLSGTLGSAAASLSGGASQGVSAPSGDAEKQSSPSSSRNMFDVLDFTLTDQGGNEVSLSDYAGKTVFVNFWKTWCGPCKSEMPDIQRLYEEYGKNEGDVVILGVAGPGWDREGTAKEVSSFLDEKGFTYPVVMDETGEVFSRFGVNGYPNTFIIAADGAPGIMIPGAADYAILKQAIEQVRSK